jgi:hypothetical protein
MLFNHFPKVSENTMNYASKTQQSFSQVRLSFLDIHREPVLPIVQLYKFARTFFETLRLSARLSQYSVLITTNLHVWFNIEVHYMNFGFFKGRPRKMTVCVQFEVGRDRVDIQFLKLIDQSQPLLIML